ncbi:MAG TPA: hypothetical protein VF546_20660 [Pyrinomonadaceae bacterium]|jgi:hypothetical protein
MRLELSARRRALASLCGLLLAFSYAAAARAQAPAAPADAPQEPTVTELLRLPGKVLARGSNTQAVGASHARSYRVEEVALPRITEVEVRGQRVPVTKAFRVIVTGGPFPVRALPAVIWLDDVAIGYGVESEDLDEIVAVTYDEAALREGATIYLSYGTKENKDERTALPEKLKLDTKGVRP